MRFSSSFRQTMALVAVNVSVFVVTGCQGEDKPAPLPDLPAASAPSAASSSTTTPSTASGKAAASAGAGARQPRFGEPVAPKK